MTYSCSTNSLNINNYTGQDLANKFKLIQHSVLDYEIEDNGAIYDDNVKFYKVDKNTCAIVSVIAGDSEIFGEERILYFYQSDFKDGYIRTFSYKYLDKDEHKKTDQINYMDLLSDKNTKKLLSEDFQNYLKNMNEYTSTLCK